MPQSFHWSLLKSVHALTATLTSIGTSVPWSIRRPLIRGSPRLGFLTRLWNPWGIVSYSDPIQLILLLSKALGAKADELAPEASYYIIHERGLRLAGPR